MLNTWSLDEWKTENRYLLYKRTHTINTTFTYLLIYSWFYLFERHIMDMCFKAPNINWLGEWYYCWALRKDSKWLLQKSVFWSETVLFFSEDEGNNCFYLSYIVLLSWFLWIAFALRKLSTWNVNRNIPFLRNTN